MIYVTREDSIELLSLSVRAYNVLRRAGIDTVGQILDYPTDRWLTIHNLGKKSQREVLTVAEQLRVGGGQFVLLREGEENLLQCHRKQ